MAEPERSHAVIPLVLGPRYAAACVRAGWLCLPARVEPRATLAEQDVSSPAEPPVAATDRAPAHSELTRLGAVNNRAVRLSDQVLPELPAPGLLAARALVGLVGAGLLGWSLLGLWVGPAWIRLRLVARGRRAATAGGPSDSAVTASEERPGTGPGPDEAQRRVTVGLRDEHAVVAQLENAVPAISIRFVVSNHRNLELVLDRIVLSVWAGQPVLHGVMAHRTPVPRYETVSTIYFEDILTPAAVDQIRKCMEAVRSGAAGGQGQYRIHGRAYSESAHGQFAIDLHHLQRDIPAA
jgi:hypothetical protein